MKSLWWKFEEWWQRSNNRHLCEIKKNMTRAVCSAIERRDKETAKWWCLERTPIPCGMPYFCQLVDGVGLAILPQPLLKWFLDIWPRISYTREQKTLLREHGML